MQSLIEHLDRSLSPFSFKRLDSGAVLPGNCEGVCVRALWKRKTWNTNRGVALLEIADASMPLSQLAAGVQLPVGEMIGYITFLYPLGLQLILAGRGFASQPEQLKPVLDKIDTQTIILQSLHAIDLNSLTSISVRTWGQVFTGRFQDAIEEAIKSFLETGRET
jgi:hypothetical protein